MEKMNLGPGHRPTQLPRYDAWYGDPPARGSQQTTNQNTKKQNPNKKQKKKIKNNKKKLKRHK